MPSPKSGNASQLVSPAAPRDAEDADVADPGEVSSAKATQQALQKGKYGQVPVTPFKPDDSDSKAKKTFIEIVLVDEEGKPTPGEPFSITMADGSVESGTLDENGFARVDGIDPGSCKISFPNRDREAWE